jgi:hypothetical protein
MRSFKMGMHKSGGTKNRGRTKISGNDAVIANRAAVELEKRTQATRPIKPGGGKNRGDRRDTDPTFTGNNRPRAANYPNPRGRACARRTGAKPKR